MADRPRRLVIIGATGRMGGTVARLAAGSGGRWEVVGGVGSTARSPGGLTGSPIAEPSGAAKLIRSADAIIDFSAPALLAQLLAKQSAALAGRPLVVGTTGLDDGLRRALDALAREAPVLVAANFSVGVNLLLALAERAAAVLGAEFDVEIVEAHHRRKVDAPSGTALALAEAVAAARNAPLEQVRRDGRSGEVGARPPGEIGIHAVRGGEIVGEHELRFIGDLESVGLTHRANDRALFAAGALRAAEWLIGKGPGLYTMKDVLGLA